MSPEILMGEDKAQDGGINYNRAKIVCLREKRLQIPALPSPLNHSTRPQKKANFRQMKNHPRRKKHLCAKVAVLPNLIARRRTVLSCCVFVRS
jgi:hypothetical protein